MSKKRTNQDNANLVDNVISDKGTVNISMKATKWIIGTLIGLTLTVLGFAWGFKINLDGKIDNISKQMKTDKVEIVNKLQELKDGQILNNTLKNALQDGDIKLLLDRTNSRRDVNTYYIRPNDQTFMPPTNLADSLSN